MQWSKRQRKVPTRPSKTVGEESEDDDDECEAHISTAYGMMKQYELREKPTWFRDCESAHSEAWRKLYIEGTNWQ